MIELQSEELKKIKYIELDILSEIDRICRKNKIKYSLAYGTLLGAVRHKGFIPWDDDIDIMMLRDEYDKFIKLAKRELNEKFYIMNFAENKKYANPFIKIMANNTIMKETSIKDTNLECGVWVDIFPLDNTPLNIREQEKHYNIAQRIKGILFCKCNYNFGQKGLRLLEYKMRKVLFVMFSHKRLVDMFNKNAKKYYENNTQNVISIGGNYGYIKETLEKKWFTQYTDIEFEGKNFMCLKNYDEYLTHIYNKYMELPPKENRIPHHYVEKINVDNYNIKKHNF